MRVKRHQGKANSPGRRGGDKHPNYKLARAHHPPDKGDGHPGTKPISVSPKLKALPCQLISIGNGVLLKRGCTEFRIVGERAAEIVRIVLETTANGGGTKEDICKRFAAHQRPAVEQLIKQLFVRRVLMPADGLAFPDEGQENSLGIFYWHFGEQTKQISRRLESRRIAVLGINEISRQLISSFVGSDVRDFDVVDDPELRNLRMFDETGGVKRQRWQFKSPRQLEEWKSQANPQPGSCLIATSDFGDQQRMRAWNEFCIKRRIHFLPIVLRNVVGYIGPFVIPGETACFECLRARQNANLRDPDAQRVAEAEAFKGQRIVGFHPSMASVLGDLAAIELIKFHSGALPRTPAGTLIEVNLLATELTARKVLKIPRCPVCSPLNARSSATTEKKSLAPATPKGT